MKWGTDGDLLRRLKPGMFTSESSIPGRNKGKFTVLCMYYL